MREPKDIIINGKTFDVVLEGHRHWLNEDIDGWDNMRANLRGANLREANLCGADLRDADLCGADLREANLRGADLCDAYLCDAYLCGANLRGADLREANLCGADLRDADLCGADLREANLREANLRDADLCDAYLCDANLREANLRGAKNVPYIPYSCPDFGIFIGFKKAHNHIVVLEIPEDAKRLSATGRKCRCDKAKVLEIQNIDGTASGLTEIESDHDSNFIYRVGEIVSVDDFDEDRWNECSTGIHFFINRQEAVNY